MSAGGVVAVLTNQLYPWLLAALHGSGATAVWAASASITAVANPAIFAMCNYLAPAAARSCVMGGTPRLRRTIFKISLLYASAATTFCLLVVVFGARTVGLVYGAAYGRNWTVVSLLALTLIPGGLSGIASRGLFALERPDADFLVGLLSFAIALGCSIWLTRLFGVTGAVVSLLITNTVNAVGRYWLFLRLSRRNAGLPW
jgi:O-antigen/teichoic acid export membrane protein